MQSHTLLHLNRSCSAFANLISEPWPLLFHRPDTASGFYRRPADGACSASA